MARIHTTPRRHADGLGQRKAQKRIGVVAPCAVRIPMPRTHLAGAARPPLSEEPALGAG